MSEAHNIEEDNKQKMILYAAALEQLHQLTEENHQLRTTSNSVGEHTHRIIEATKSQNHELHIQIETMQAQNAAEVD